jgi:hypothetical protein
MKLKSYQRQTPEIKMFEKKVVLAVSRLENVKSVHDSTMNGQICHGKKTASAVSMTFTDL